MLHSTVHECLGTKYRLRTGISTLYYRT